MTSDLNLFVELSSIKFQIQNQIKNTFGSNLSPVTTYKWKCCLSRWTEEKKRKEVIENYSCLPHNRVAVDMSPISSPSHKTKKAMFLWLTLLVSPSRVCAFQTPVGGSLNTSIPSHRLSLFPLARPKDPKLVAMATTTPEDSKCPVTQFANSIDQGLVSVDKNIIKRSLRIANHLPAFLSLGYFGLISMASMMQMGPMADAIAGTAQKATLASVLTQNVGSTTNTQFAALFPTLVTPAPFVFLVWPLISVLQFLTVSVSAFYPSLDEEILTQTDLSSLTLANLASTAWLLFSSKAQVNALPLGSALVLPLVPLFAGYPLRNRPQYILIANQVFSSFTTLASILAFTVEIQHGGRIPFFGTVGAEVAGLVFWTLYSVAGLAVKRKSLVKRIVNWGAVTGILVRRVTAVMAMGLTGWAGWWSGAKSLLFSVSFLGGVGCWFWSFKELFTGSSAGS